MAASPQRPVRIAMWSGPRNVSTALMRSWDARGDTHVWDEPFYAHYLHQTGTDHPGREEIIATYETRWRHVARALIGPVPDGKSICYQKHMAHHLLPGMAGTWLLQLRHGFLIRDPKEMLISLARVTNQPSLEDTGLPQQNTLLDYLSEKLATVPPIVDARDILEHPEPMLRKLCDAFDVKFAAKMLSWSRGTRPTDGVWGRYWYASVCESTGFRTYRPPGRSLPERLRGLYGECLPFYDRLYHLRLTP